MTAFAAIAILGIFFGTQWAVKAAWKALRQAGPQPTMEMK